MLIVPSQFVLEMLANPSRNMFHFGPIIVYINESSTLVKTYGIQMRCYWEHIGEHISTNKRTQKKFRPQKNWTLLRACWAFSLATWKIMVLKLLVTIFNLVSVHQPQMEEKVEYRCIFNRTNNGYWLIGPRCFIEYSIDVET
jgi:hypothetical protein